MPDHLSTQRMPQLPAASGRLVLWERTQQWRRLFLNHLRKTPAPCQIDPSVLSDKAISVESLAELRETIENHPASFVFAEVTVANFRELLGLVPRFRRSLPRLRIAVVCFELTERSVDEYYVLDTLFREAGASTVLTTQRELLAMLPNVVTHFVALPQQENHWRQLIELRLPWRNV